MDKIFISDLHLEENRSEIADLFIGFLKGIIGQADSLYILGDFFEAWIGDDHDTPFNRKIITSLAHANEKGLPIYFMHGNRDFLIGKKFLQATRCTLLPDEYVVDVFGKPTLLMHGDTLCTHDLKYLKFRKKSRTWIFKKLIALKSLESRLQLAKNYREKSKMHTSTLPDYIMDVTQAEVERLMQKNNVQHFIHGHTHRPDVHHFTVNGKPATRTVLGAWHDEGSALICKKDGTQELIALR